MIRFDNGGDHEWFMRILVPVIVFTCLCGIATAAETIAVGKSSFEFIDHQGDPTRPVTVWTFIPEGCLPGCPVQYVFHGVERNGEEYLGNWIGFAKADRRPQLRADGVAEDVLAAATGVLDAIGDARVHQAFFQALRGA